MTVLIDGKELAKKVRNNLRIECEELKEKGIKSKLAVIMVGDDPASKVYVRNKSKACQDVGIEYEEYLLEVNKAAKEIVKLLDDKLSPNGYKLQQNNGNLQEVKHYHLHIVPSYIDNQDNIDVKDVFDKITK